MGISQDANHFWINTKTADTNWPSVYLIVYGTNDVFYFRNFTREATNGFFRPIVNENDTEIIANAILYNLKQIGINSEEQANGEMVKPNEVEFYIMDRAN